ncbi:transposase [bacterium 1XD42-8]|nr:transposase [bacterium 1XD42-8]
MLAAYFEGKQIALHKLSYSKNTYNVNKEHYKSMIVKSGFDVENTLLNNPDLMDLSIPDHSLKKYDELMGDITL